MKMQSQIQDRIVKDLSKPYMKEHPFTIGNNCLVSYLYKYAGIKFNHPFVWSSFTPEDFLTLVSNFRGIDFGNTTDFSLVRSTQNTSKVYVKIRIDDIIDLHCVHYLKEADRLRGHDVLMDNIVDFARDKYTARLERMKRCTHKPWFVMHVMSYDMYVQNKPAIDQLIGMDNVHVVLQKPSPRSMCYRDICGPNCFTCWNKGKELEPIALQYLYGIKYNDNLMGE